MPVMLSPLSWQVAVDAKLGVDVEEYVASFRADLADALAAWSRGARFAEIMKMTDVFEARCCGLSPVCCGGPANPCLLHWYMPVDCASRAGIG